MTTNRKAKTLSLGSMVEKLFDQAETTVNDTVRAADFAARRLQQVLMRGGNARLALALSDLALEFAPAYGARRVQPASEAALRRAA